MPAPGRNRVLRSAGNSTTRLPIYAAGGRNPSPYYLLEGFAGTGKTTLVTSLARELGRGISFIAPTGKAASVLRRKGASGATTIHRFLYEPPIVTIDADGGIWVSMGYFGQVGLATQILTLPVTLTSLVVGGGTIAGPITLGFACRIMGISYVAAVTGTGAGATFAVNLQIGGVSTTGGVCAITLANTGYAATPVLGTAVTALNIVSPTSTITLINAAGTVFTAGSGYFLIQLA